jgi:hypothetical protein
VYKKGFTPVLLVFLLILLPAAALFAIDKTEPLAQPLIPMIRAMGNAYTAVSNDENAVYFNPAGYGVVDNGILSVFSLGLKMNVDNSALKVYSALIAGKDITSGSNITTYLSDTTIAAGIAGPVSFGRVGNNFGFSFYDNANVLLTTRPGGIMPSADFLTYVDIGFIGGYGIKVPIVNGLYAGINLKVILRVKSQIDGTLLDVIDAIEGSSGVPLGKSVAFGSDAGLLYMPLPYLHFGVTARDFFGTRFNSWENISGSSTTYPDSMIKPRIAFGTALYPLYFFKKVKLPENLVLALDYADLLDYSSVLSNLKFGVRLSTLRIIDLLGGIDGGYLTGGVDFNLKFFRIGIAYYVDELGSYPGASPAQNLMLHFGLQW